MKRPLLALRFCAVVLVLGMSLAQVAHRRRPGRSAAAENGAERVQRITARLQPGEIDASLLKDPRRGASLLC